MPVQEPSARVGELSFMIFPWPFPLAKLTSYSVESTCRFVGNIPAGGFGKEAWEAAVLAR